MRFSVSLRDDRKYTENILLAQEENGILGELIESLTMQAHELKLKPNAIAATQHDVPRDLRQHMLSVV
ncbi:MAG: hypothetical protein J2P41_08470 [Blastocatellia bacterium]|nr:hypothetical protein [Blastocatellia bacterium]